jgi:hypothetical protein
MNPGNLNWLLVNYSRVQKLGRKAKTFFGPVHVKVVNGFFVSGF